MPHTVLLVDDDQSLLQAMARVLRRESFELLVAGDAESALALLRRRPVEVVVSDYSMPGLSGLEFLARVRAEHPEVLTILQTGHGPMSLAPRAITSGEVYRFVTKPYAPDVMASTIRQALYHGGLIRQARRLLAAVKEEAESLALAELEYAGARGDVRLARPTVEVSDGDLATLSELVERVVQAMRSRPSQVGAREA